MKSGSRSGEEFVKALPPAGEIEYRGRWLHPGQADMLLARLTEEIDWEQRSIRMFGRTVLQPRLIRFQGDPGVRYTYSGDSHAASPWHPEVAAIRDRLRREGVGEFNSVLLNLYRDGADSMGWHADDEPELGEDPLIASISLGGTRRFVLRRRADRSLRHELSPGHGSLIVMRGDLQHHWQHQVPRTRRPVPARINLTFRRVVGGLRSPTRSRR